MATFCGVSSTQSEVASLNFWQWPNGHTVTWTVRSDIRVMGFTASDITEIFSQTWKLWDQVSGISIQHVTTPSEANIVILSRPIDGPMNVLAEAELPEPGILKTAQKRLWLDEGERWVNALNAPPNAIDVFRVALHEGGHSIGLGHQTDQTVKSIMAPAISDLRSLQQWDINQAQLRYGIDKPPQPTPTPGEDDDLADLAEQIAKCLRQLNPKSKELVSQLLRDV